VVFGFGFERSVLEGFGLEAGHEKLMTIKPATNAKISGAAIHRALGIVLSAETDYGEHIDYKYALQLLNEAHEANNLDATVSFHLAQVTISSDEEDRLFREALAAAPDCLYARLHIVYLYLEDYELADRALEFLKGHERDNLQTLYAYARCIIGTKSDEAVILLDEVICKSKKPDSDMYSYKAVAQEKSGPTLQMQQASTILISTTQTWPTPTMCSQTNRVLTGATRLAVWPSGSLFGSPEPRPNCVQILLSTRAFAT